MHSPLANERPPSPQLDDESLELIEAARWTSRAASMMLALAAIAFVLIVTTMSGSHKDTGGAVYTASGVALTLAIGGGVMVRSLSTQMSREDRGAALAMLVVLTVFAGIGLIAQLLVLI